VRYDTRGAGFSEKIRGPLTIDTMTDDLIGLLDGLGISEKVSLAGTAVGGAIALHTAFRFPERIAAVAVTSPATFMPPENRAATLARVEDFERNGVRVALETTAANGYPEELRGDRHRFDAWRARWLGNRSGELCGGLPHAVQHRPHVGAGFDQMPGAGDRRRGSTAAGRLHASSRSPRPFLARNSRCYAPGTMRAGRRRSWWRRRSGRFWIGGWRLNRRPAPQNPARLCGEHAAIAVHHRNVVLLHLPHIAFAAQLAHALDRLNSPYMPGWQVREPPPLVLTASLPPGATLPADTNAPPSPFRQKPSPEKQHRVDGEGVVELHHVAVFGRQASPSCRRPRPRVWRR